MEITAFQSAKLAVMSASGLGRDALHVYFGLAVLFLSALALRKPLRSWGPWGMVLAVAVVAELLDFRDDLASFGRLRWAASVHDILNTLFWPSVILLLARRGGLFPDTGKQAPQ